MKSTLRERLIGEPLPLAQLRNERYTNPQALSIFGADPISSVAYASEEILKVLILAGPLAMYLGIPISLTIAAVLICVTISYRQIVFAYPDGGGAYRVSRQNLGENPSLMAAAALCIDYILTAAVSSAASVLAITSAVPWLASYKVELCLAILGLLTIGNLRGVKESGKLFSIPPYFFMASLYALILYGVYQHFTGDFPVISYGENPYPPTEELKTLGIVLILKAFSSGCTAMTGVEAISNGVQAFQPDESKNAAQTIIALSFVLGTMFLGISLLASWSHVVPFEDGESVISQIARNLFGQSNIFYYAVQISTALILLLAANTPYADLPRVLSQLAQDGYLPRQFANRGRRLVFSNGIFWLTGAAAGLTVFFGASVHALIPLYAVGVFLSFTLSQSGMVKHWLKEAKKNVRESLPKYLPEAPMIEKTIYWWKFTKGYRMSLAINGIGAGITGTILMVVAATKFTHGAWMLPPTMVIFISTMKSIKRHYKDMAEVLSYDSPSVPYNGKDKTIIIPISAVNGVTRAVMEFAESLHPMTIHAIHVALDPVVGQKIRDQWAERYPDVELKFLLHPYTQELDTAVSAIIKQIAEEHKDNSIHVVFPKIIPPKFIQRILHNQRAYWINLCMERDPEMHVHIHTVQIHIAPFCTVYPTLLQRLVKSLRQT